MALMMPAAGGRFKRPRRSRPQSVSLRQSLSRLEACCREVVVETASTRDARPKLHATLAALRAGDTLVIYKPDRVARSMKELLVLLEDHLHARGINLHILSGICAGLHRPDGATIADKMLFMVAAMAAEMERDLIRERTLDGLRAAQVQGRRGGRPAAVADDVLAIARASPARRIGYRHSPPSGHRPLHALRRPGPWARRPRVASGRRPD